MGNLRHDLRTPLNHIIGYCEMLLEESAIDARPQLVADLERIHLAGRRLLVVINDLFDPIKSATYKANPALIHHEIRTPLNQIIGYAEMLQEEAHEQGANAFAEDAGKILDASRKLLILTMENFGQPNAGLDAAESPVGTLSTALLRRDEVVPASSAQTAVQPLSAEQGASILIVDDDEGNRTMLSRRLQRLGFRTTAAENGRSALEKLKGARFDLMLLDIQMPELNGYQVLECLKADAALRDIPVIVLSASDEIERVARCIEMGAEDYLPKPFDPVLLQARIGASLEKKRLRDREISHLRQIQEEKQRSDDLLHIILPHDVAHELKTTQAVKPRRFENVGVLFCDIVSFTAWCDKHAPDEILTHLQSLVEAFERMSFDCGLEKIKTIGDSFMATAGLLAPAANPALDCVRCGLAMIGKAKESSPHWQVRVGVHVGPVMAGVVGRRKYQYDIWGDTVNTAARMEQAALPGSICVTADTWKLLAAHCNGVRQGNVDIKGKGTLDLYRIDGLKAGG
jgi:CheY-like chemotaxis protein/class 3 adenylate cyclase